MWRRGCCDPGLPSTESWLLDTYQDPAAGDRGPPPPEALAFCPGCLCLWQPRPLPLAGGQGPAAGRRWPSYQEKGRPTLPHRRGPPCRDFLLPGAPGEAPRDPAGRALPCPPSRSACWFPQPAWKPPPRALAQPGLPRGHSVTGRSATQQTTRGPPSPLSPLHPNSPGVTLSWLPSVSVSSGQQAPQGWEVVSFVLYCIPSQSPVPGT